MILLCLICVSIGLQAAAAGETCEASDLHGDLRFGQRQLGEFSVPLHIPDGSNADIYRRHFLYATTWARAIEFEVRDKSNGYCDVIRGAPAIQDLRLILAKGRNASVGHSFRSSCEALLQDVVLYHQPDESVLARARSEHADLRRGLPRNSNDPIRDAINLLDAVLPKIFSNDPLTMALLSVNAGAFDAVNPGAVADWIVEQRSRSRLTVTPVEICESGREPRRGMPNVRVGQAVPPTVFSLAQQPGFGTYLRRVIAIGHANGGSAELSAKLKKICNRQFEISSPPSDDKPAVMLRCVWGGVEYEQWTTIYCDPQTCRSDAGADAVLSQLLTDQEFLTAIPKVNGVPRGPYLVRVD